MALHPRSLTREEVLDEIFADPDSDFDVESSSDEHGESDEEFVQNEEIIEVPKSEGSSSGDNEERDGGQDRVCGRGQGVPCRG